jgi:hypothetical protein
MTNGKRFRLLFVSELLLVGSFSFSGVKGQLALTRLPRGHSVKADGIKAPDEWNDAATASIHVKSGWDVPVRFKRDSENIYLLFENVKHGSDRLFPEILIDASNTKSPQWEQAQWWFHISHNLCEANGEPNVYMKNGVFQCAHQKVGWAANNPPRQATQTIEVSISFKKLGIRPASGARMGLAFGVTNATGDESQRWFLWPRSASVYAPKTWGTVVLQ